MAALLTNRGVRAGGAALAVSALGGTSFLARLLTGWLSTAFRTMRSLLLFGFTALGILPLARADATMMGILTALIGVGLGYEANITP